MPIYEYACEKCKNEFEVEQRITDDAIQTCPRCKSRKVKRLISRTSFVLKGGGWYSDLYSSSSAKDDKAATPDSGDAKPADGESGLKSEAKSEPKGESKSEAKSESKGADTPKGKDKPSARTKAKAKAARR